MLTRKLLLTSPRNSVAAHWDLFGRLKCKVLLSANPRPPAVTAIIDHQEIRVIEVPSVSFFLDTWHHHFEYDRTWPEAQSEPLFVIHTSGSTGMPKPLLYTNATGATNTKMMSLDPPAGYGSQDRMYQGKRVFITFPPFHVSPVFQSMNHKPLAENITKGAYLVSHLFNAVSFGTVMIAPISGALPSGQGLVEALQQVSADIGFIVPSIMQDLAQSPELLDYCAKHLQAILYCGGDLPQAIGDTVASQIPLFNQFGASELGLTLNILSLTNRSPGDWKYAQFHPELGLELRHISDGVHELYAVRDPEKKDQQPTFTVFPDAQEYASRDLFVRHPSKDKTDLWSWQSRADDIIIFLNGEKTNPISMEQHIVACNRDISAALVVGAQRFQAALLVEPVTDGKVLSAAERAAFIERIWPTVEDANKNAPSHARLMKSHVLFTQPQKPMLRAGKGTVQRSGTLKLYADEINALYRDADIMSSKDEGAIANSRDNLNDEIVSKCIRQSILSIMKWSSLDESANFFELGMDSLHVLVLVRKLRQSLAMPTIALSTVYTNPSVSALKDVIVRLSDQDRALETSQERARVDERKAILKEYKNMVDRQPLPKSKSPPRQGSEVVILTGSTGNVGSYILNALLCHTNVAHIYCLNRAMESHVVQMRKNRQLGLDSSPDERVSFLTVDLSQEHFNLPSAQYEEMLSRATLVIHNAWIVNFNLPLSSFKPQLDGIVNFLSFANDSIKPVRLFYVSSISSAMSQRSQSGTTPEEAIPANSRPGSNGYAESKFISEQILEYAAQKMSGYLSIAFARVGQVAGAANHSGIWNKDEWFPSMIMSSVHVGAIPDSLGPLFDRIDWVPIDLLAEILVDLALKRNQSAADHIGPVTYHAEVYHPLNPHPITWTDLRAIILDELSSEMKSPVEVIPLRKWVAKVRKEAELLTDNDDTADLETTFRRNPAAKLVGFYEDLVASENVSTNQLETSKTLKVSERMRELEPIKDEWMRKWIREWLAMDTDKAADAA